MRRARKLRSAIICGLSAYVMGGWFYTVASPDNKTPGTIVGTVAGACMGALLAEALFE